MALQARAWGVTVGALGSLAALALAALPVVGTTSCATQATGGGTGAENPAGAPIVLGASIDQTGSLKGNAPALNGGILAAVQQVNALGGVLGRQVTVVTQDDQGTAAGATKVAEALQGTGISALIGPISSTQVTAIEPFIQKSKLVNVSAAATSTELTGACKPAMKTTCPTGSAYAAKNSFFFRTVPSDAYQAIAVGVFASRGPNEDAGTGGCKVMDVVHATDDYGNPLAVGIESFFESQGGTIPSGGDIGVAAQAANDYTAVVDAILAQATLPDCLVIAAYPQVAATFMQSLDTELMTSKRPAKWPAGFFVIGTDGVYDPSFITDGLADPSKPSGTSFINGTVGPPVYGTVAQTSNPLRPQYNELVNLYVAEVGFDQGASDLDPYTSNQYDATILTLLAMQAAGTTTDGAKIQQAMFDVSRGKTKDAQPFGPLDLASAFATLETGGDINYQGASGDVDFTDYGDVVSNFLIWAVQGQGFVNHSVIEATDLVAN